jgi:enamine deaminase RidA (YjgF/YER057c/UK114 family)
MVVRLPGPYASRCRAIVHGGYVHLVEISPEKSPSLYRQAKLAFEAVDKTLIEAGSHKSKILTVTVFITDMSRKEEMNRAWDEWVDMSNIPMRACFSTELLNNDLIEVLVTATT